MISLFQDEYLFVWLLFITQIILLIYAYNKFEKNIFSPSTITLTFFTISIFCFICNLNNWIVVFTFKAYSLYTLSFLIMIGVESYYYTYYKRQKKNNLFRINKENHSRLRLKKENFLFIFFITCIILYIYRVYKSGMTLGATSLLTAIGYNKEEGDFDNIARLLYNITRLASYVYVVLICYNVIICKETLKRNWKSLTIILFTIIMTFFSGQRSSMICYIMGIMATIPIFFTKIKSEELKLQIAKFKRYLFYSAGIILFIFFTSASIVKGKDNETPFVEYITYYFGSTNALMGRIIEKPQICHTPFKGYWGEKTFLGFWNFMYENKFVDSEPADRQWINMGDPYKSYRAGNEFSFFCAPYIDFGYFGTLIFIAIFFGVFANLYYKKILCNPISKKIIPTIAIYIFLYAMISMNFYQDTIRSYTRPINIVYIIYIILFCRYFITFKKTKF